MPCHAMPCSSPTKRLTIFNRPYVFSRIEQPEIYLLSLGSSSVAALVGECLEDLSVPLNTEDGIIDTL